MIILLKRIISFVIFMLIGFFFYKVVVKGDKNFFNLKSRRGKKKEDGIERMEKDPVCGTYVLEKTSFKLKSSGELYFFCSEKCREEYISHLKK